MDNSKIMPEKDASLWAEILNFFTKSYTWILFIGVGMVGKFGMYFRSSKRDTGWQILGSTFIAGFVGYLASVWCMNNYPISEGGYSRQGAFIVPMATLLSDRVIMFLMNINYTVILERVIEVTIKNKKK